MDFDETWQEASPQHPLSSLCFSRPSEIQDGRPGLWLAETFFDFFSATAEWIDETWQEASPHALYQVCVFRADRKSKMATLASDWLKHFSSFHNLWMDFDETWQEASPQRPLSSLCFSCRSEIQDCRPGLWLAETFFDFFSAIAEWILTNLDKKQVLNTLYQVCADLKSKIAALASDWLKHFSTSSPQPLNGFWRNFTGSKSSTPSIKLVFFVRLG